MEMPTVGRVVHYVSYGTPGGEYLPEHRAAIVTAVSSESFQDMRVSLCVLNPTGMFFNQDVPFEASGTVGGRWHWPERAR